MQSAIQLLQAVTEHMRRRWRYYVDRLKSQHVSRPAVAIPRLDRYRNFAVYGGVNVINVSRDDDTISGVRNLRIPFKRIV